MDGVHVIRRLVRRRPSTWLIVAGLLAALAAVATMRAAASGPTAPVLVASADLSAGSAIGDGQVLLRAVPADGVLPGMLTDLAAVGGRVLVSPVRAGEPITQSSLGGDPEISPRPLDAGERAVSIPSSAAGATIAAIAPGTRVDVAAPDGQTGRVALAVRDAEVIAVVAPAEGGAADGQGAILIRVTADEALALSGAGDQAGGVRVIVRPFGDGQERP